MKTKLLVTLTALLTVAQSVRAQGTAFSYQGRLADSGSQATGNYDLVFTLHDAASGGNQVGAALTNAPVAVNNGLFSETLDFGAGIFNGTAYWLEIGVRTNGSLAAFATLTPRQALSATPYALYTANAGVATTASAVSPNAVTGAGLQDGAITAAKVAGGQVVKSLNGLADNVTLSGGSNVTLTSSGNGIQISMSGSSSLTLPFNGSGASLDPIFGMNNTGTGDGIYGSSPAGNGVRGESGDGWGVFGRSQRNIGAFGQTLANGAAGVMGRNDGPTGTGGAAVSGYASTGALGVLGVSEGSDGVAGRSNGQGKSGVSGYTAVAGGYGGSFYNPNGTGAAGTSGKGVGVYGSSQSTNSAAIYGENFQTGFDFSGGDGVTGVIHGNGAGIRGIARGGGYAGYFEGTVQVNGILAADDLNVSGSKHFKIDHPLDPANKYLLHASVESPDVMNIYNVNVTTDASGEATVTLPSYFGALNRDFRYQLTVIGQFAQAIVASKIKGNQFTIKTDKPDVEVSWQVTGIRQDAYMKAHPMVVEQDKPANERSTYQHPELCGEPQEKGLAWAQHPRLWKQFKAERTEQTASPEP